jgi:hypothetical protein
MTFEDYIPGPDDIIWAVRAVSVIRTGGILAFPTTRLFYGVDHETKTLTLMDPSVLEDETDNNYNAIVHRRAIATFRVIGYQILVRERHERGYENP